MCMKTCPKCQNVHEKSGTFCSRTCANSRILSEASLNKKRETIRLRVSRGEWHSAGLRTPESYIAAGRKKTEGHIAKIREKIASGYLLTEGEARYIVKLDSRNMCAICAISQWQDKPLTLHLDHIDGNHRNNSIENLRMICPNCHSQTDTYCNANIKSSGQRMSVTDEELLKALLAFDNISQALRSLGVRPQGVVYERCKRLLDKHFS